MAMLTMIEAAKEDIKNRFGGDNKKIHVAVAHSNNLETAQHFLEEVKKAIPDAKDYYLDSLSLSVSTHIFRPLKRFHYITFYKNSIVFILA